MEPTRQILVGDCLHVMRTMADNSVDAVVTDPPYGLKFMGKRWDCEVPGAPVWAECLRVLKPGGHLLAFAGTRTQHRMCCNIEDGGFEIRDMLAWVYGSGFTKGFNLKREPICDCAPQGNAIQYTHHGKPQTKHDLPELRQANLSSSKPSEEEHHSGLLSPLLEQTAKAPAAMHAGSDCQAIKEDHGQEQPGLEGWYLYRAGERLSDGPYAESSTGEAQRVCSGAYFSGGENARSAPQGRRGSPPHQQGQTRQQAGELEDLRITSIALDAGALSGRGACPRCGKLKKELEGFSTSLKPAFEPITLARKPFAGTVAANVLEFGTGAINVDGCRVGADDGTRNRPPSRPTSGTYAQDAWTQNPENRKPFNASGQGRWPANLIHDGSDEVTDLLGDAARFFKCCEHDAICTLCCLPYAKSSNTIEAWKSIFVRNAKKNGWTSQAISGFIARVSAIGSLSEQLARSVKSAGNLCDSCATLIAVALAATKTSDFSSEELQAILASMGNSKSSILMQNLASFADLWANIDIIPTTGSFSLLLGSVHHAIENSIKKEEKAKAEVGSVPEQATRFRYEPKASKKDRDEGLDGEEREAAAMQGNLVTGQRLSGDGKPIATPRRKNHHPTVKPTDLMRYLCRLVTPPGGLILDPFAGSGSTGKAAMLEGFGFVGIEMNAEYAEIAKARAKAA